MSIEMLTGKVAKPIQHSTKPEEGSNSSKPKLNRPNSITERLSDALGYASRPTLADYHSRTTFAQESHADVLFQRTITALAYGDIDNEESWTKSIIQTYKAGEERSVAQGSMPAPAAFAKDYNFWKAFAFVGALGAFLGFCALGFMNIADKVPRLWVNGGPTTQDNDFFECGDCPVTSCVCTKYENCQFYQGKLEWIAITTAAGFVVGCLRFFSSYPDNLPGLFQEIHAFHVNPVWAPYTIVISAVSLAGGASLGPEQGLGNLGGGLATYITDHFLNFEDDDYRKLSVLGGMAAALGALLPTPILGAVMFQELGEPPKTYMESTLILSAGAIFAFLVYYSLVDKTYISSINNSGAILSLNWEFEEWNCLVAFVIGLVSACLGLVLIIFIGITKQIFNRIRHRLDKFPFLVKVVPPMIAGAAIGTVNWALPLTVGNGNQTLNALIRYGYQNLLSQKLLMCTGFSRMFLLAISMNGGFIGGFIFPIISIGIIAGVVAHQMYPGCPIGMMVGCFMAALPASICPMPMTLCGIAIYSFFFGLYQTAPIFISAVVSYTLIVGSGLFGELQKRGRVKGCLHLFLD